MQGMFQRGIQPVLAGGWSVVCVFSGVRVGENANRQPRQRGFERRGKKSVVELFANGRVGATISIAGT